MKMQVIILISIVFLAVTGIILLIGQHPHDKEMFDMKRVILDVLLVFLGFSLAVAWDVIKDYRHDSKEKAAIITMLKFELGENHAVIEQNLKIIQTNRKAMGNAQQTMIPLSLLKTDAWDSAKLRNNLFVKNTSDLFKLVNLYTAVHIVNEKIVFRENYRISNQAMSNYNEVMKIIDNSIEEALTKTLPLLENTQNSLDKMHSLKVEGPGFTITNGFVAEK